MSGFERRSVHGHSNYILNQQMALPISYSQTENHDFGSNGTSSYHLPHHSYNMYHQCNISYSQNGVPSSMNEPSSHSVLPTPDHDFIQHESSQCIPHTRYLQAPRYLLLREAMGEAEIDSQESINENTMLSEPVVPPLEGFPSVREFDQLIKSYVEDLSIKKQDKALIHARRARNIKTVLMDPKDTAVESAQFRFWVKKMFKLQLVGIGSTSCTKLICHEGKPVAIREKLFKILTKAHQQCQHGGRDKTSAQVRQVYSWVPKELISRFVKICPTCQVRRGGVRTTPPISSRSSPRLEMSNRSPKLPSPPSSRRESIMCGHISLEKLSPDDLSQFSGQPSWLDHHHDSLGRSNLISTSMKSFGETQVVNLPNVMSMAVETYPGGDLPQISYSSAYTSVNDQSRHREF